MLQERGLKRSNHESCMRRKSTNETEKTEEATSLPLSRFVSSRNAPPQQGGVLRDGTKTAARETKKHPETVGKTGDQG